MEPETTSIALTPGQVQEFSKRLSKLRHDLNNHLTLIISAGELMHRKPEISERMLATIADQATKIEAALRQFSEETERALNAQKI